MEIREFLSNIFSAVLRVSRG